jgi:hypothetical protein
MTLSPEALNADCTCISLDRAALNKALAAHVGDVAFCRDLAVTHPTLISDLPVFLRTSDAEAMGEIIAAIERVARLSAYREAALLEADPIARFEPGPIGVFMGYDFHLGPEGPQLIEINTNAGGALINAYVAQAQKACCGAVENLFAGQLNAGDAPAAFVAAFRAEWRLQRGDGRALASVAIVDREPATQYLMPEFTLFARLFAEHGLAAVITSPDKLVHRDGGVWVGDQQIDLVYNRSTDFALGEADHAGLRSAYLAGDVVVTPNPHAHALFADKRNLVRLCDADLLASWGVAAEDIALLARGIPKTVLVSPANADALWRARNGLFFKPAGGFGSKAAYRGDKVTHKAWQTILAGTYVAQALVAPSTRTIAINGERHALKVDVRNYTYDGAVQLVAARLYQGQTTNMRTAGGGFSPVFWQRAPDDVDSADAYLAKKGKGCCSSLADLA